MRRFAVDPHVVPALGADVRVLLIVFENAIFPHASLAHFVHRPAGISFFLRKDQAIGPPP